MPNCQLLKIKKVGSFLFLKEIKPKGINVPGSYKINI